MEFKLLYQELTNSTEMIRALLLGVTQEEAQIKPNPEAWSILEVACHLYDEEREDFLEHLDLILHRQSEAWQQINPQGWVTERKYNEQNFIELQEKFFTERWKSLEWLTGLSNPNWDTEYVSPFGSMKAGDMFAAWIAHDNLHVRQLVELRRSLIERSAKPYDIQYAGDW
jgi:hypothetical protein